MSTQHTDLTRGAMENGKLDQNIFISFINANEALILMLKTLLTSKRNRTAHGASLP